MVHVKNGEHLVSHIHTLFYKLLFRGSFGASDTWNK